MSADLLAPLARLVTTGDAIEGLRDLFAAEEPPDDIAARVAETAVAAIPNADAISITVLTWPDARTAASTHEWRAGTRSPAVRVRPGAVPGSSVAAHAGARGNRRRTSAVAGIR